LFNRLTSRNKKGFSLTDTQTNTPVQEIESPEEK